MTSLSPHFRVTNVKEVWVCIPEGKGSVGPYLTCWPPLHYRSPARTRNLGKSSKIAGSSHVE